MKKIFIDGRVGTTGLQIYQRLDSRKDIQVLTLPEEQRKEPKFRQEMFNQADIVFLCLPDEAARQAVELVENPDTVVIDTSTAHRTNPDWAYGFPELSAAHREKIIHSKRIANPGCHASGFISIVYPLVAMGILPHDAQVSCFSLTGYSGGGKKMIAQYEGAKTAEMDSPALYAIGQGHKHLPEMQLICGLDKAPVFCPVVDDYYKGMATTVTLHASQLKGVSGLEDLRQRLMQHYAGQKLVRVSDGTEGIVDGKIYGNTLAGKDTMLLIPAGSDEQITITALFDNLGKGASGAAVQNMNLILGLPEETGLDL